ncbi:hypothetical protein [Polaribacter sp.]|uniref:hypothetical protein n=1 Tax=Polaribacter sp. TaxID=1920175 RepID=UPI003F698991
MISLSKKTLFILMILSATFASLSLCIADIDMTENWKDLLNKASIFISFSISTILFMIYYVKKVKEDKNKDNVA